MPRCLFCTVFSRSDDNFYYRQKIVRRDDPGVMMTRSGLSIKKSSGALNSHLYSFSSPSQLLSINDSSQNNVRKPLPRRNSTGNFPMLRTSDLSIVTRFELLLNGVKLECGDLNLTNAPIPFLLRDAGCRRNHTSNADPYFELIVNKSNSGDKKLQRQPFPKEQQRYGGPQIKVEHFLMPHISKLPPLSPPMCPEESLQETQKLSNSVVKVQPKSTANSILSTAVKQKANRKIHELLENHEEIDLDNEPASELKRILIPFACPPPPGVASGSLFKCIVCRKVYGGLRSFGEHVNTHLKLKNNCHICGRVFSRNWLLKGHLRIHTGEKPFTCDICGKAFADKSNLRSHMLIHSVTTKSHTCAKCGKSFAQRRYLHKHLLEVCVQKH